MSKDHSPDQFLPENEGGQSHSDARRTFLKQSSILTALALTPTAAIKAAELKFEEKVAAVFEKVNITLDINGKKQKLAVEPRTTLLDLLREQLNLTGTKKGCDYGQCGACTVHVDGQRVLSCLTLAAMADGKDITTIEGLANGDKLHPMQEAFIKHDGFQCGYCTPGQIMSAVACIREGHADSDEEIREYMSGNLCRCGAYPNIVNAIKEVKNGGHKV
ncbi:MULTISPECIES: (2Fe-2S)-binding protein [Hymenobacteraceae]|uniref:(2Fe-2S)-binding protein n=1 Tax=Hymenobacteraceae TaxID=1853232 RepID=UPI0019672F6D|nr:MULTISPECIES: (2Fe-2S)-binding protein [Hymenobacteraceae]